MYSSFFIGTEMKALAVEKKLICLKAQKSFKFFAIAEKLGRYSYFVVRLNLHWHCLKHCRQ